MEYYGINDYRYYYLAHHGIKGQKWGVRRFQNADGSLTPAGKKRITKSGRAMKKALKDSHKTYRKSKGESYAYGIQPDIGKHSEKVYNEYRQKRDNLKSVKDQDKAYKKIDKLYDKDPEAYERALDKYENSKKHPARAKDTNSLAVEYAKKLNRATVKDLGFDNVDEGIKYLKKYNLDWNVDGGYMRFGKSAYHV